MRSTPLWLLVALLIVGGCEGKKQSRTDELVKQAQLESAEPVATHAPKTQWAKMPDIHVDSLGVYIGGERARLGEKKGAATLAAIVKRLPIEGKPVTMMADRKALIKHVAQVAYALGEAGAPTITIKTPGRGDLPGQITVTPEGRLDKVAGCSVCVMVNDKLDTGVWTFRGALGRKHPKGFAGPDLSNTGDTIKKRLDGCKSHMAFFSGSYKHQWQHAYNLGALILQIDKDKKIDKLVLLADEPVAGRAVKLRK